MKRNTTKRAMLLSALALVICMSMFVGTTYAWFTDSVTSANNVIKAGNLDIEVEYTLGDKDANGELIWKNLDGAKDLFSKGLWEPGHTEVVILRVKNNGSLALKYNASINIVDETLGKTKDGADIKLSDILTVSSVSFDEAGTDPIFGINIAQRTIEEAFKGEDNIAYSAPVAFNQGSILNADSALEKNGDIRYIAIKVDMAETVGNEANHNGVNIPTIDFGINVVATQFTYEKDSFDNQYDKDAKYPEVIPAGYEAVATADEAKAALAAGKDVFLLNDISFGEAITVNADVDIDLNGKVMSTVGLSFNGNVTIENGFIRSAGATNMAPHLKVNGNLEMEDVDVMVDDYLNYQAGGNRAYGEYSGMEIANGSAVLNDCEIYVKCEEYRTWNYVYGITMNNANVTINGGKIVVESAGAAQTDLKTAVSAIGTCTVTMLNVDVQAETLGTTMGKLDIKTTDTTVGNDDFVSYGGTHTLGYITIG